MNFLREVFPNFSLLDAKIGISRPQIRILREISSLEPAGKLENPASRPKNVKTYFLKTAKLENSTKTNTLDVFSTTKPIAKEKSTNECQTFLSLGKDSKNFGNIATAT